MIGERTKKTNTEDNKTSITPRNLRIKRREQNNKTINGIMVISLYCVRRLIV